MTARSTRLETWRTSRASRVLHDLAAYIVYAVRRFYRDSGAQAAGALTYTTLLAMVPMLAIAFAVFSAFPAFQAVQDRMESILFENLVPEVGSVVRSYIAGFTRNATNLTAVGLVALGVSAVLLLATIESTFNTIWRVERERPLLTRLLIFWTVLTLGPVMLGVSFSLTTDVFEQIAKLTDDGVGYGAIDIDTRGWGFQRLLAGIIQSVAFTALFLVVPARTVHLRDAAIGGVLAGVAFELLKWGFKAYLVTFPTYQTIYGTLAVFPIFLIWLYLSWTVIIIGAVVAASFPEWWNTREAAVDIELDPARRLEAAMMLLKVLVDQARVGGEAKADALAEALPLDSRDGTIEALRINGYLVMTDQGGYALTRDLRSTPLVALARDLDLTLGLDDTTEVDPPARRAARRLDAAAGRLSTRLRDLARAEERILGVSIAEVLDEIADIDEGQSPAVVSLPQADTQPSRH